MNQDQQGDQAVQAIADWFRHVDQDGYYGGEPGAVHALRDARALYRSVVAPLLAERDAELERWRTGLRRHSWPTVQSVPDGIQYAAALARAQGTEGGDEHDRLLREAAIRLRDLDRVARVLLADRDRVEASRRDWAAEADAVTRRYQQLLGAIWLYINWRYVTKQLTTDQKELWADAVDASGAEEDHGATADRWWTDPARPQCSVHPDGGGSDG